MTRRRDEAIDAPGTDSFLDVVANLVGILIILVMVIGVRARDAMVEAQAVQETPAALPAADVAGAAKAAKDAEDYIHEVDDQIRICGKLDCDIEHLIRRNRDDLIGRWRVVGGA